MKLFTLIAAALISVSASAQTFTVAQKSFTTDGNHQVKFETKAPAKLTPGTVIQRAAKHPISETPEGTLQQYSLSTSYYDSQMDEWVNRSSIQSEIVIDGSDFYIKNICTTYQYNSWIHGELSADHKTVTFENMQPYYENANGDLFYISLAYVAPGDTTGNVRADTESDEFVFNYDEATGTLTSAWDSKNEDNGLCVVNEDGGVFAYNTFYEYEPFNDVLVTAPAGLTYKPYSLRHASNDNYYVPTMIYIAQDGNDYYFRGLSQHTPNTLVKGTYDSAKDSIIIQNGQYVGLYEGNISYYLYLKGATYKSLDENGFPIYSSKDYATLKIHKAVLANDRDGFDGPDGILITLGKARNASYTESFPKQEIREFREVAAKPKTPYVVSWNYDDQYSTPSGINYVVPVEDTNSNYINPDSLYYRLFLDGKEFRFTKDQYPAFLDEIYVNSKFSDRGLSTTNGKQRTDCSGSWHVMGFDHNMAIPKTISIQSVYRMAGKETFSDVSTFDVATKTSTTTPADQFSFTTGIKNINTVDNSDVVSVKYYDLSGRELAQPESGIVIQRTQYSNGTNKAVKVIVK